MMDEMICPKRKSGLHLVEKQDRMKLTEPPQEIWMCIECKKEFTIPLPHLPKELKEVK